MLVEEAGDFGECRLGLGRGIVALVVRVRLALEHLQECFDTGIAQLATHTHGVAEQEVTRAEGRSLPHGAARLENVFAWEEDPATGTLEHQVVENGNDRAVVIEREAVPCFMAVSPSPLAPSRQADGWL